MGYRQTTRTSFQSGLETQPNRLSPSTQRGYLSDGSLAQVSDGTTTRLYLGDMVFDKASNGTVTLESAGWEGGRLLPGSGSDKVLYVVKDHLGSVRVVKDGAGNIRQRFDYYPYGTVSRMWTASSTTDSSEKRYRFGGKEIAGSSLTDLTGIGAAPGAPYLDFGARLYSPRTATWLSPDPMLENYYDVSPYAYCAGNPIILVDIDGRSYGDYYSYWGYFVGTDGLNDNKLYLIDDLGITNFQKTFQHYNNPEEKAEALSDNTEEVDGLIIVERERDDVERTVGEFFTIGEKSFSGYTMERDGPPTITPNLKKPIPKGFYDTKALENDFRGGFAFWIYGADVPDTRKIYGHIGNNPENSSGCVLFGLGRTNDKSRITESKKAMSYFRDFYWGKTKVNLIIR